MKMTYGLLIVLVSLFFLSAFIMIYPAGAGQIPRITNFIILVDPSPNMFEQSTSSGSTKTAEAKKILQQMSDDIPEFGYSMVIPFFFNGKKVFGPETFQRESFRIMTSRLPAKMPAADVYRSAGLAQALLELRPVLSQMNGKTTVVILSDGSASGGADPVEAAQRLWGEEPGICFDVISLADSAAGRARLKEVAGVSNCAYADGRRMLTDQNEIKRFVQQVFFFQIPQQPSRKDLAGVNIRPGSRTASVTSQSPPFEFILFDSKSAGIDQKEMPYLIMNVVILQSIPDVRVRIEGHSDKTGKTGYNRRLSQRRAQAVFNELVRRGIRADRMKVVGRGESMPAVSNLTPSGRSLNRRVEIVVGD